MFRFLRRLGRFQFQFLIVLVALLIAARVAMPYFVLRFVNQKINAMPGYGGHIADVDIHLWRGAYTVQGIDIVKTDGKVPVPFFSAQNVDFSVEWWAIFQGSLVAKIVFDRPVINFVAGPTEETSQVGVDKPWLSVIKDLFPLNINRFEVLDGSIHYRDFYSKPKIDLPVTQIHVLATNLTNSSKLSKSLIANIEVTAIVFGSGRFGSKVRLDPRPDKATFDLQATIDPVPLEKINDFTRAYAYFDFEKGTFAFATELAAKDGHIEGYIKPIFDGIVIADVKDIVRNPIKLAWEGLVGGVTRLLRNQPKNRFATKIPISGDFDAPRVAILPTLGNLFKNEFVRAYQGNLDGSINFGDAQKAVSEGSKAAEKDEAEKQKAAEKQQRAEQKAQEKAEKAQQKEERAAAKAEEREAKNEASTQPAAVKR
jgi:hypothetical protein